jgi:hypothetical protein
VRTPVGKVLNPLLIIGRTFARQVVGISTNTCATDPNCLSDKIALLKNQRVGLIDPDTPKTAFTKTSNDGEKLKLVVRTKTCLKKKLPSLTMAVL